MPGNEHRIASRPEARSEYSRGFPARIAVPAGALAGAALLCAAEFMPLLRLRAGVRSSIVATVGTGSHHDYALLPIALLVAALADGVRRASRAAVVAIGLLGVLALGIAVLADLPAVHARGLVLVAGRPVLASAVPAAGFYLETLGAVVLVLTAGLGALRLLRTANGQTLRADPAPIRSAS